MSDDDPVERFVEETFDGEDDGVSAPEARDMEAELRSRMSSGAGSEGETAEVDSDVATAFWAAVIYVNAGILLVALGPTVYAIRGRPLVSAALVGVGVFALSRAYSVYRQFAARDDDQSDEADEADDGEDAGRENDDA